MKERAFRVGAKETPPLLTIHYRFSWIRFIVRRCRLKLFFIGPRQLADLVSSQHGHNSVISFIKTGPATVTLPPRIYNVPGDVLMTAFDSSGDVVLSRCMMGHRFWYPEGKRNIQLRLSC
jgi:hypothetical protein